MEKPAPARLGSTRLTKWMGLGYSSSARPELEPGSARFKIGWARVCLSPTGWPDEHP